MVHTHNTHWSHKCAAECCPAPGDSIGEQHSRPRLQTACSQSAAAHKPTESRSQSWLHTQVPSQAGPPVTELQVSMQRRCRVHMAATRKPTLRNTSGSRCHTGNTMLPPVRAYRAQASKTLHTQQRPCPANAAILPSTFHTAQVMPQASCWSTAAAVRCSWCCYGAAACLNCSGTFHTTVQAQENRGPWEGMLPGSRTRVMKSCLAQGPLASIRGCRCCRCSQAPLSNGAVPVPCYCCWSPDSLSTSGLTVMV